MVLSSQVFAFLVLLTISYCDICPQLLSAAQGRIRELEEQTNQLSMCVQNSRQAYNGLLQAYNVLLQAYNLPNQTYNLPSQTYGIFIETIHCW